jgi:hypothetical protein
MDDAKCNTEPNPDLWDGGHGLFPAFGVAPKVWLKYRIAAATYDPAKDAAVFCSRARFHMGDI